MWIFDSYFKGNVELWSRERGLSKTSVAYPPSFYMHLKDPHANWDMIEGLENRYNVEECSFNTIFVSVQYHKIFASPMQGTVAYGGGVRLVLHPGC